MAIGDIISATDYNNIQTKISNVMSTGSGNTGYGQPLNSSAASVGNTVTKAQWDALRYDVYNALYHQTGSAPSINTVAIGDVIRYGAANPNFQYDTLANTATSNRFNIGTGQFFTSALQSASRTSSWSVGVQATATVSFNNANEARWFFNSGGKIRFTSSRSGGASTAQNNAWSSLLSSSGTQVFGGNTPTINFYNLTSSYQTFYLVASSAPYSSNNYRLEALCNVSNNSSGTATSLTFRITWTDSYRDPDDIYGSPSRTAPDDIVDGTLSLSVDKLQASGGLQPSGTFAVVGPSASSISSITGS